MSITSNQSQKVALFSLRKTGLQCSVRGTMRRFMRGVEVANHVGDGVHTIIVTRGHASSASNGSTLPKITRFRASGRRLNPDRVMLAPID